MRRSLLALGWLGLTLLPAAPAHGVTFSIWALQNPSGGQSQSISVNPSSPNVWFGEYESDSGVGFITPAAAPQNGLTELIDDPVFKTGTDNVTGMAIGPDGNAWFAQGFLDKIGRIGVTGAAVTFDLANHPTDVTVGGDGAIWIEEDDANKIARVPTNIDDVNDITEFTDSALASNIGVTGLTTGPDGALYFSEGPNLARMATDGTITHYPLLGPGVDADQIAWGPDTNGNTNWIWFTRDSADGYGRFDPANGTVQTFTMPAGVTGAQDLAPAPDGRIYLTARGSDHIVRLKPGGTAESFPAGVNNPYAIVAGPDGNVWFTEDINPSHIARMNILAPTVATFPATVVTDTGATLNASVSSRGSTDTNYSFTYATNPDLTGALTSSTGGVTQDEAAHGVSKVIGGLTTGATYYFKATATNSNGSVSGDVRSFIPGSPTPNAPVNLTAPQVTGNPQVGSTLVCLTGSWTNDPTVYSYQWNRAGTAIDGETASSHTLVDDDADKAITCTVTAANTGGATPATTNGVTPTAIAPQNFGHPTLDSRPMAGRSVTCRPGTWAHNPSLAYSWELDGQQVATGTAYTPQDADVGRQLACRETATNSGGTASATSEVPGAGVNPRAPVNTVAPTLSETVKVWEKVVCHHGTWTPTPINYEYAWLIDGEGIPLADDVDYYPTREQVGHKLTCRVTAYTGGISSGEATSAPVEVQVGRPLFKDRPRIVGTAEVGRTLYCIAPESEDANQIRYQWFRWNAKIDGATGSSYELTADDSGTEVACQVIGTGPGGTSQTLSAQVYVELFVRNTRITGIEVTQGIQTTGCVCIGTLPSRDQANPKSPGVASYQGVRMAAGKWLVVRVFAEYSRTPNYADFGKTKSDPLKGVSARLEMVGGSGPVHTFTPDSSPATIPEVSPIQGFLVSLADRADASRSFNFLIPWQDTNHKSMSFRATLARIPGKGPWQCDGCGANQFTLNNVPFVKTSDTPIRPYPIAISGARTDQTEAQVFGTTQTVLPTNVSTRRYAAPIEVNDIMTNKDVKDDDRKSQVAARVAQRASDDKIGIDEFPVGVFVNGTANLGALTLPSRVLHEKGGPPISIVRDKSRPLTSVMHEIGHGHGLPHADTGSNCGPYTLPGTKTVVTSCPGPHPDGTADCTGNSLGQTGETWPPDNEGRIQGAALDRRNWDIYRFGSLPRAFSEGNPAKSVWYDWMSYCANTDESDSWISVRNWDRLLDYHKPNQDQPARAVRRPATTRQVSDPVRVIAVVGSSGDASIFDVAPGQTATGGRATGSGYALELRDAAGNPLPGGPTTTDVIHVDHAAPGLLIQATLPLSASAASVALTSDGTTVASRQRSAHPPTAAVTAPKGGSRVGAGKTVTVQWTASDADGDALTTTVDYSADDGKTWHVIADAVKGTSATVPSALLSASRKARVRVRVNDGFDTATATSKRFTAVGVPPRVQITSGVPGGKARADDVLQLDGTAFDDTGRALTGKALRWFAGKRRVGRGEHVAVRGLPAGKIRIRLVARDKLGRTGSAAFPLTVTAVVPEFLTYVAPERLATTARKVTLTLSTTVPAKLQIRGKRYSVGRTERKITVRFKPGKSLLHLPYVLRAGAKKARGSLQFKRG